MAGRQDICGWCNTEILIPQTGIRFTKLSLLVVIGSLVLGAVVALTMVPPERALDPAPDTVADAFPAEDSEDHAPMEIPPAEDGPEDEATLADRRASDILEENVGMIIVYGRYTFYFEQGEPFEIDLVAGTASCFAVSKDGLLVTNRHVTAAREDLPKTWVIGDTRGTLDFVRIMACFGPDVDKDHYECRILHESSEESRDVAILRIDREFKHPLGFAEPKDRGQTVVAAGYPGVVAELLNLLDENAIAAAIRKRFQTGESLRYHHIYTASAFHVSLTRGIISAFHDIQGVEMIQTDAAVQKGNSGGPLLDEEFKVLGILTFAVPSIESYNFAVSQSEILTELEPYLREP